MATVTGAAGLSAIGTLPKVRVSGVNAYVDVYRLCKLNNKVLTAVVVQTPIQLKSK